MLKLNLVLVMSVGLALAMPLQLQKAAVNSIRPVNCVGELVYPDPSDPTTPGGFGDKVAVDYYGQVFAGQAEWEIPDPKDPSQNISVSAVFVSQYTGSQCSYELPMTRLEIPSVLDNYDPRPEFGNILQIDDSGRYLLTTSADITLPIVEGKAQKVPGGFIYKANNQDSFDLKQTVYLPVEFDPSIDVSQYDSLVVDEIMGAMTGDGITVILSTLMKLESSQQQPDQPDVQSGSLPGKVFVYKNNKGTYTLQQTIDAPVNHENSTFGKNVAISDTGLDLAVGDELIGGVYLYKRTSNDTKFGSQPYQTLKIFPTETAAEVEHIQFSSDGLRLAVAYKNPESATDPLKNETGVLEVYSRYGSSTRKYSKKCKIETGLPELDSMGMSTMKNFTYDRIILGIASTDAPVYDFKVSDLEKSICPKSPVVTLKMTGDITNTDNFEGVTLTNDGYTAVCGLEGSNAVAFYSLPEPK
eukprot:Colp12_sorted_trinity150504_noHs@30028